MDAKYQGKTIYQIVECSDTCNACDGTGAATGCFWVGSSTCKQDYNCSHSYGKRQKGKFCFYKENNGGYVQC
jgi:hypothetical protein